MIKPIDFRIYKGVKAKFGAVQFALKPPFTVCNKCNTRSNLDGVALCKCEGSYQDPEEGVIFVNICGPKGPNVYDWDNKIVFAMSVIDVGKTLAFLTSAGEGDQFSLLHDPGANTPAKGKTTKNLSISTPQGLRAGCMFSISQTTGEDRRSFTVPIAGDEVIILGTLLRAAIPRMLAW